MTKTEQAILTLVRDCNNQGALAGLGTAPDEPEFNDRKNRFVKRLYESKSIVWVRTKQLGAGWVTPESVSKFKGVWTELPQS